MSDIYVPIDISDIKSVIPPGEDIVYSTMCKCAAVVSVGIGARKSRRTKWVSHVLLTTNGVAYTQPNLFKKRKPSEQKFLPWTEFDAIVNLGRYGSGFSIVNPPRTFKLTREENYETKEKFAERSKEFVPKFRPFLIEKKLQWVEESQKNPAIKKRRINGAIKFIKKMQKLESKRIGKERKKQQQ